MTKDSLKIYRSLNIFQETKFFMKFYPIGINIKTSAVSVYIIPALYTVGKKTFKMTIHAAKVRFPIHCCRKFTLFSRYFYI